VVVINMKECPYDETGVVIKCMFTYPQNTYTTTHGWPHVEIII
jgi:hypothetical protein